MRVERLIALAILVAALAVSAGAENGTASSSVQIDISSTPAPGKPDSLHADSLPPIEKMPVLKQFVKADYPPELVKAGVEGTVVLDLLVSDSGRVDSVAVVKGIHPLLDSSAAHAARAFTFAPALAAGKPVPVILEYAYRFSLDQVMENLDNVVNFKGRLLETGTRAPIRDALVAVSFPDSGKGAGLKVPFASYLKKLGSLSGQSLQDGSILTTTDSLGWFKFKAIPACTISVKVIAAGYANFFDLESIHPGKETDVLYRLDRVSFGDLEVVAYGHAEKKEVSQQTLTLNQIQKIPGLGGDAVKVITALPGVARPSIMSGQIVIRGAGTGDSHFYLDGVTIPQLFHFGGVTSTYNSEALQSVDLYPGGFGVRYGDAMGGVVEITGRHAKTDRIHGYVDGNLFDASFLVEGPISKDVSFLVAGRRSYIANVIDFALTNILHENLPFTVVPYYYDYEGRIDWDISKSQHLFVTLFGSKDKLDLITNEARGGSAQVDPNTNEVSSDNQFDMGIVGWDWDISKVLRNELRYSLCKIVGGMSVFGFVKENGNSLASYFRDDLAWKYSDKLKWHFGIDAQIIPYNMNLTIAQDTVVHDTSHYQFGPYGVYTSAEWKPIPKLTLTPGLRLDYYPELRYSGSIIPEFWNYPGNWNHSGESVEPSFRLAGRYELDPKNALKASIGTYNETPQPLGQSIDRVWGNPDLPAEKGSQYVAGYERKLSDLVSLDVQTYYNRQWDDAHSPDSIDLANNPNAQSLHYLSDGKARMYGLEIMLKHEQSKRFFGWIAYSLSRSERWRYNGDDHQWEWSVYNLDQTHDLQLIGSYKLTPKQELGMRFRYVTGDPTTPVYPSTLYDAGTARSYVENTGPKNSGRMDAYISLDLRYEKTFTYKTWLLHAYVDVTHVENLFNKGYKSPETGSYIWNYDYTEKNAFADITRPAVGIRMDF